MFLVTKDTKSLNNYYQMNPVANKKDYKFKTH